MTTMTTTATGRPASPVRRMIRPLPQSRAAHLASSGTTAEYNASLVRYLRRCQPVGL
jgi:hypothetical protein